MRVFKEVLVLAVIVIAIAYAARQLEGVDAGEMDTSVPSFTTVIKQFLGWADGNDGGKPKPAERTD